MSPAAASSWPAETVTVCVVFQSEVVSVRRGRSGVRSVSEWPEIRHRHRRCRLRRRLHRVARVAALAHRQRRRREHQPRRVVVGRGHRRQVARHRGVVAARGRVGQRGGVIRRVVVLARRDRHRLRCVPASGPSPSGRKSPPSPSAGWRATPCSLRCPLRRRSARSARTPVLRSTSWRSSSLFVIAVP